MPTQKWSQAKAKIGWKTPAITMESPRHNIHSCANIAVARTKRGSRAYLATPVRDPPQLVRRRKGVRFDRVASNSERATGASVVLSAESDCASIIDPGSASGLSRIDLAAARVEVERADLVAPQLELDGNSSQRRSLTARR